MGDVRAGKNAAVLLRTVARFKTLEAQVTTVHFGDEVVKKGNSKTVKNSFTCSKKKPAKVAYFNLIRVLLQQPHLPK